MHFKTQIGIVGTGFAGLGMAIRLKQAGIHDFVVMEKGDDVGGTWRENFYPGAACDVQSHLYSFSFAPNPNWSRQFAPQEEILQYLRDCADKFGIMPHIKFNSGIAEGRWDEQAGLWRGLTTSGDSFEARVVVTGCGAFNKPVLPNIPGIESFQGELLHTAKWKRGVDLKGKRIAVIGTGASAIQVVPEMAKVASKMTLFQRTPAWIMPKPNPEYTATQKRRFASQPFTQKLERSKIYAQNELFATAFVVNPKLMSQGEKFARSYLAAKVKDPVLREKLTPKYAVGCKRILLSSEYYPALTRDNVEVVTDGIKEVRAHSVVTRDGREHELDALVCATGFQVSENVAPFQIYGRNGLELNEAWTEGAEAYKGTTVKGYPNAFILLGPNTGLGHSSVVLMIEAQINYALQGIKTVLDEDLKSIEVRAEVQDRFNVWLHKRMSRTVWQRGGCVSYYTTASGKNTTLWPGFTFEFMAQTRNFDRADYVMVKQQPERKRRSALRLVRSLARRPAVRTVDAAE
jgi:cation diffusion facilitator CzcD-associated flavoprotein CzcO